MQAELLPLTAPTITPTAPTTACYYNYCIRKYTYYAYYTNNFPNYTYYTQNYTHNDTYCTSCNCSHSSCNETYSTYNNTDHYN